MVFSQVSECLQLVCGVEVREVNSREYIYFMVSTLGLTCDAMLSGGQGLPKAGLLVLVLSLNMWNGDRAPEEAFWGALSRIGLCVGSEHWVFGEPKELLTQVWVQEGYLEYQQVLDSHLPTTSSCGVPRTIQRPASGKSWHFCSNKGF